MDAGFLVKPRTEIRLSRLGAFVVTTPAFSTKPNLLTGSIVSVAQRFFVRRCNMSYGLALRVRCCEAATPVAPMPRIGKYPLPEHSKSHGSICRYLGQLFFPLSVRRATDRRIAGFFASHPRSNHRH